MARLRINIGIVIVTLLLRFQQSLSLNQPSTKTNNSDNNFTRRSVLTDLSVQAAAAGAAALSTSPILLASPTVSRAASAAIVDGGESTMLPGTKKPFPLASFGLQIYNDDTAYSLTMVALEVGYRNFFASVLAGNQKGFARAIKASGIPREEIYICGTVLSNRARGEQAAYEKTKRGCDENLLAMSKGGNIDYLDMIMLDYPGPDTESIRGQWRAFEEMRSAGAVDALAVSNFSPTELDAVLTGPNVSTKPTVNQLPYSVAYHPRGMLEYNKERNILVQSWSPLSRTLTNPSFRPVLSSIGSGYGKSAAQVALRWIVQNGAAFTTQSKSRRHFEEDLNVFDFTLTPDEMEQISRLGGG